MVVCLGLSVNVVCSFLKNGQLLELNDLMAEIQEFHVGTRCLKKFVDLCSFDIGVVSYNVYFVAYNTSKINIIQLISNAMWKSICQDYIKA